MPYSIGGDKLEKAKVTPKKYLNPKEEQKLSGDMRELYDRLLPSKESEERSKICAETRRSTQYSMAWEDIKVHVFGSSGNMLCTSDSDGGCRTC
jgi:DNA polymerase sigma